MGFWDAAGETLFGTQTRQQGKDLAKQGGEAAQAVSQTAGNAGTLAAGQAAQYDEAARQSMGANAADYMRLGQEAAQANANQSANAAATQGTQAALQAARSSGLNKGQAALAAGQQAGNIYTGAYQQGLESGQNRYQEAAGQLAGQGQNMAGRQQAAMNTQLGAAGTQAGIGAQQQGAAADTSRQTWGTIGTAAGAIGQVAGLLSDERCKDNVETVDSMRGKLKGLDVMAIARKIRPVSFEYKSEVANPGEKVGVIAQDLEKTALSGVVKEGPDGLKRIDTEELTPALLNMVIQLANEVSRLKGGTK
jgi:hypothetical protein